MPETQFDGVKIALDALSTRMDGLKSDINAVSNTVSEVARDQTVFEYKHDQAKRVSEKLEQIVDRITEKGEDELRKTIEMLDRREEKLTDSIVTHKEIILRDVALQHQTIQQSIANLTKEIGDIVKAQSEDRKEFATVQKWVWMLMGSLTALGLFGEKLMALITG
jgi:archaellum component FlaC